MPRAQPWEHPPQWLARSTAEALWRYLVIFAAAAAVCTRLPAAWAWLPSQAQVPWLLLLFCSDETTSGLRLFVQVQMVIPTLRRQVLSHLMPCWLHRLSRNIVPLLRLGNTINNAYRAAHAMIVASYFATCLRKLGALLLVDLTPLCHPEEDAEQERAAKLHLLHLTVMCGKPRDLATKEQRELHDELLFRFSGPWNSKRITWRCTLPGCAGGNSCRLRNVALARKLYRQAVWKNVIQIQCLTRWWKLAPLLRQLALGVGLHQILPRSAPERVSGRAGPAAAGAAPLVAAGVAVPDVAADALVVANAQGEEDAWGALHGWRVQATSTYLFRADTQPNLLLI